MKNLIQGVAVVVLALGLSGSAWACSGVDHGGKKEAHRGKASAESSHAHKHGTKRKSHERGDVCEKCKSKKGKKNCDCPKKEASRSCDCEGKKAKVS